MQDVNSVTIVGRLTKDPELRQTGGGMSVCVLRLAFTQSRKDASSGRWEDTAGYIDVTTFGATADNVVKYLAKGRQVVVNGRLSWREWEGDNGKQQRTEIVAHQVQFVGGNDGAPARAANPISDQANPANAPVDNDDSIPF